MQTSSAVRGFIDSIPKSGLFVDRLTELAATAGKLAKSEPQLATPFTLIQGGFDALARHWEDEPLSPYVSDSVTPFIVAAVKKALEQPEINTWNDLASALNSALKFPLISGVER